MEQQKLPNVTISLVLGIISFIACCCSSGIGGVLFSGIALFLANKDKKTLEASGDPSMYTNASQLNTSRIIAIIGLVLAVLTLIGTIIYIISLGGIDAYMEQQREAMEQLGM
ncbi:CCC motif membrane protein [uncultured Dokdonia sp.]|uniref:CCC motif membrane protein n=1 Tax=uncultured Dokdonia sp. TaxID=575653 RepID=UPI002633A2A8|nr:CCC motif membrane protein [uncultured Dokdonia sp.]